MNFEINKESFFNESFSTTDFINGFLQSEKSLNELDVLTFRLNILQREISSESDTAVNNLVKNFGSIESDLNNFNGNLDVLSKRYYEIRKNRDIQSNNLDKLQKAASLQKINNNITYFLEHKNKEN